jgi:hypothetical protein
MIVKSERVAATLLFVVVLGTTGSVWGQASKPAPTAKPALTPAELVLLNGFYQEYSLEDGEVVKHFAPPFHPGRIVYYRQTQPPALIRSETEEPDSFFFHWHRTRLDCVSGAVFGVGGLSDLIPILLDFHRHEIEGDEELLHVPIRGDWILRDGASDEQILAGMEKILRDELQIPVKISVQELERKVLVAKGDFRFAPMGDSKQLQVYGQTLVKKGGGGGSGDLSDFLRGVGRFIGRTVVSDVRHPPEDRLTWHYNVRFPQNRFREEDRNVESVLKHVTEQTGLTFSPGPRLVRVLLVERAR